MPEGLITIAALGSQPVLVFLTQAIVAATKAPVDALTTKYFKFKTKTLLYAWLVASVLIILGQLALGAEPGYWVVYFLSIINGIVVAFAAGKANDMAKGGSENVS